MAVSMSISRNRGGSWFSTVPQQPHTSIREAKKQYEKAHKLFEEALKAYDRKHLSRFTAICGNRPLPCEQDVLRTVAAITDRAHDRKRAANVSGFFERLIKLAPVGDVVVGGAQNLAVSGAWGAVRLALEISVSYSTFFEKVSDLFVKIGKFTVISHELAVLFPQSVALKASAFEYFTIILEISTEVVNYARKSRAKRMLSSILDEFTTKVEPLSNKLQTLAESIDRSASVEAVKANQVAHRNTQTALRQLNFLTRGNAEKIVKKNSDDWRYRLVQQLEYEGQGCGHKWSYYFGKGRSSWLLDLTEYQDWKDAKSSSTFWLNGKLGSGKSVAMASMCADLTSSHENFESYCNTVSHFFCMNSEASSVRASTILSVLTAQIVRSSAMTASFSEYLIKFGGPKVLELASHSCIDLLLGFTPEDWRCFILLDGLDQLSSSETAALFQELSRLSSSRCVLVGVSSHHDEARLRKVQSILFESSTLTAVDMDDIDRSAEAGDFITAEFAKWERRGWRFAQSDTQKKIAEALITHWNKMFLWLKLQMELIEDDLQDREEVDYQYVLSRIHPDLDALYERRLLDIPVVNRWMSRVIFQLVTAAEPALKVKELRIAANIDPGSSLWLPTTLPQSASDLCSQYGGKLLEVDESSDEIHLIHGSVAVHLCGPSHIGGPSNAPLKLSFREATDRLGLSCLRYFNLPDMNQALETRRKSAESGEVDSRGMPAVVGQNLLNNSGRDRRWLSPITHMRKKHLEASLDVSAFLGNLAPRRAADYALTDFVKYAEAHWLTATRTLDLENADIWLWEHVWYGKTKHGKVPDFLKDLETGMLWAIEHGHRHLFSRFQFYGEATEILLNSAQTLRLTHLVLFEWEGLKLIWLLAVELVYRLWENDRAAFDDHWLNLIALVYPTEDATLYPSSLPIRGKELLEQLDSSFLECLLRSYIGFEEFASLSQWLNRHIGGFSALEASPGKSKTPERLAPIALAVRHGYDVVNRINVLVAAGAHPNDACDSVEDTALLMSVIKGDLPVIECLLHHGASIDLACKGETPLTTAIGMQRLEVVQCLVLHGASLQCISHADQPILSLVVHRGGLDILKYLLEFKSCDGSVLNALDTDGFTALFHALRGGKRQYAEALIERGVRWLIKRADILCEVVAIDVKVHMAALLGECQKLNVSPADYELRAALNVLVAKGAVRLLGEAWGWQAEV